MLNAIGNPNGRPNRDVVKLWANGLALLGKARTTWIIDFGVDMSESDASLYEMPFEYIKHHVLPIRMENNRETRRKNWWLHSELAPAMRRAVAQLPRYIATPRIAKHRVFVWVSAGTHPDDNIYVFAREDDYFFGMLHSQLHELWSLRLGTSLEDRPRYTASTTFETFPFPWAPGQESQNDPRVQAIAAAARRLVELRDNWLNPPDTSDVELKRRTLTNLYNQRPTWLDNAHKALDRAVFDAYGWPHDLADDELLARLLVLNAERTPR